MLTRIEQRPSLLPLFICLLWDCSLFISLPFRLLSAFFPLTGKSTGKVCSLAGSLRNGRKSLQLLATRLHFSIKFFILQAELLAFSLSGPFPRPVVSLLSRKHSTVARYKLKTASLVHETTG